MEPAFLQDLLKISPLVAILAWLLWQARGDSKEDRKAVIDVYAKTATEAVLAIKDVTAYMTNSAKTDEMVAKSLADLTKAVADLSTQISRLK